MKYYLRFFISISIILICTSASASEVTLALPLSDGWCRLVYDKSDTTDAYKFRNGKATLHIIVQLQEPAFGVLQSEIKNEQRGGLRVMQPDPKLLFGMDHIKYSGVDKLELMPDLFVFGTMFWGHGLKVDIFLTYKYLIYPEDNVLNEKLFNALLSSVAGQIAGLDKQEILPIFVLHGVASSLSKCGPL